MTFEREAQIIYKAASDAIREAMERGRRAGYNGQWLKQSREEHLRHALAHLEDFAKMGKWEDLENGLTRFAMIAALARRED